MFKEPEPLKTYINQKGRKRKGSSEAEHKEVLEMYISSD